MMRALTVVVLGLVACADRDPLWRSESSGGDGGAGGAGTGEAGAPLSGDAGSSGVAGYSYGSGGSMNDTPRPFVVASNPALDATGVYPAPFSPAGSEQFTIELNFSNAMRLESDLQLRSGAGPRALQDAVFSDGGKRLLIQVAPDFTSPHALLDETTYELDLSTLRDDADRALEPNVGIRGGKLTFTTGVVDELLNHSCSHTFFGPFRSIGAQSEPSEAAPDIGQTHIQYEIALPESGGTRSGWVRAHFVTPGNYRLFLDVEVPLRLGRPPDESSELTLAPTAAACQEITHEVSITGQRDTDVYLLLGPVEVPIVHLIVEHDAQ